MANETHDPLLLEAKYKYRETQALAMLTDYMEKVEKEVNSTDFSLLNELLVTPPFLRPFLFQKHRIRPEDLLDAIKPSIFATLKLRRTALVLTDLSKACDANQRRITEVSIDAVDKTLPEPLKVIYGERIDDLQDIAQEAYQNAGIAILNTVEGETPLTRYRRDLAEKTITLTPTISGGISGKLPTKVPNVNVNYFYEKDAQFPVLSLIVYPFE